MTIKSRLNRTVLMAGALGLSLAVVQDGKAVDFIRGDANGDGVVSISDAQSIDAFIFRDTVALPCMNAADVDDNGFIQLTDGVRILNFLFRNGVEPMAPFPAAGPDPMEPDLLWCDSYGGGSPIDDPAARLTILDATTPVGAEGTFSITVAVSSSRPLAGYSGALRAPEGLIAGVSTKVKDLSGTADKEYQASTLRDGVVVFAFLSSLVAKSSIPAGQNAQVLLIQACLAAGTTAGEYALQLESGELVDFESARAIHPELVSGTLTVLEDVTAASDCSEPPPNLPPVDVTYKLTGATAPPGGQATVEFIINATAGVQGYSFSVDFDEEVLSATEIEEVWEKPSGSSSKYSFSIYDINNKNENPGSQGVDEGFLVGAAVFDFQEPVAMPAKEDVEALAFHFQVKPETTASSTAVTFLDGGKGSGQPVKNRITANGLNYTPSLASSFVFINGIIQVIPDVAVFIRGDSNGDGTVDISDSQRTLAYLFLGEEQPSCYDAADANDDGRLDVSDAIYTLGVLFLGKGTFPPPNGSPGEDPTPDTLGCLYTYE